MTLLPVRFVAALLALVLACVAAPSFAQQGDPVANAGRQLSQSETDVRSVDRAMDGKVDADARKALRAKANAAGQTADVVVADLTSELQQVDARLAGLGAASKDEAPEIKRQRAVLTTERGAIDAAMRRAKLVDVEAAQLIAEIDRSQAQQFAQTVSMRVPSPLTPAFWEAVFAALPRDFRRIELFLDQGGAQIAKQWHGGLPWQTGLGIVVAFFLLFPGRVYVRNLGQRFLIEGAPGHRVRRSAYALWRVVTGTLAPLLAAVALVQGMRWSGLLPERWSDLLDTFVAASGFGGFSAAVTGAVLMRSQPSWRIASIDDDTANRLRPLSWVMAGLAFGALMLTTFNTTVGASRAATVATQAIAAVLHQILIVVFLMALARIRNEQDEKTDNAEAIKTQAGLGLLELGIWIAVAVSVVALLIGYVGLGLTIGQFLTWGTVLGAATYLLIRAADDILTTVFNRNSRFGQGLARVLGVRGSAIDQFGLVIAGILRIALIVIALALLFSPFGAGGGISALFGRLGTIASGLQIGGVSISPGAIIRGFIVLFVGLSLARAFMGWLDNRYLPVTDLDNSARNSVSMIARYVAIALAVIWALASLGIGVERIAILLSALSVGIGFGLQAITQNFISGLILLAERPIKIGDLIKVGNDEGDVKRISVRSTEIELGDHSTLIVPNSKLITDSVLNKTASSPLGRVQIQFSVPIEVDADKVAQIVLDAYAAEDSIYDDPSPSIFIDSIADGRILFNSFAHCSGPRAAYSARSNVFKAVLRELRREEIDIGTVPQRLELAPGATPDLGATTQPAKGRTKKDVPDKGDEA